MKKNWEKTAMTLSGSPENFQGTDIWGALRGHLCDSTAFFLFSLYDCSNCNNMLLCVAEILSKELAGSTNRNTTKSDTEQHCRKLNQFFADQ